MINVDLETLENIDLLEFGITTFFILSTSISNYSSIYLNKQQYIEIHGNSFLTENRT